MTEDRAVWQPIHPPIRTRADAVRVSRTMLLLMREFRAQSGRWPGGNAEAMAPTLVGFTETRVVVDRIPGELRDASGEAFMSYLDACAKVYGLRYVGVAGRGGVLSNDAPPEIQALFRALHAANDPAIHRVPGLREILRIDVNCANYRESGWGWALWLDREDAEPEFYEGDAEPGDPPGGHA